DTDVPDTDTVETDTVETDTVETDTVETDTVETDVGVDSTPPIDTNTPPVDTDVAQDTAREDTALPFTDPIVAIQTGATPPGTNVTLDELVVTGVLRDGVFVEQRGGGPYSGVFVLAAPQIAAALYIDAVVALSGVVEEVPSAHGSLTRINVTGAGGYIADYLSTPSPPPGTVTVGDLADPASAEMWEGVLVRVRDARVWDAPSGGVFTIGDAARTARVSTAVYWPGDLVYGDRVGELWGVLHWQNDRFELLPRRAGDYQTLLTLQAAAEGLAEGELTVSEWMLQPSANASGDACTPASGQYVEVANTSGRSIDLDGLLLYGFDSGTTWQLRRSTPLAAGDRATLFSAGSANCYGFNVPDGYGFVSSVPSAGLGLFNHSLLIDAALTVGALPGSSGAALELSESQLDAVHNDDAGAWCDASTTIGVTGGDRGTPGRPNACP
ncbi:MAG TPA: hypothetical protein PKA64_12440, partial [Myxococcota bacterium]|nr:hypothetical protein [Myxococcota bacterium]